jgi:hypothetical protein
MVFAVNLMMVNNAAAALVAAVEDTYRNTQDADWVETKHVAVAIDVDNDNHRSQTSTVVVVVVVAFLVHEILNDLLNEGNTVDTLDCMDKGGPAQTPFDAADADLLVLEMT